MFNLINMREDFKEEFQKKHGVKLGFMSAFVKASASALKELPVVNAGTRLSGLLVCRGKELTRSSL